MNDRTRKVLERMRQNTRDRVVVCEEIATEQTTQSEDCQQENYQIIFLPKRGPMNAGVDRRPSRHRELQKMMSD